MCVSPVIESLIFKCFSGYSMAEKMCIRDSSSPAHALSGGSFASFSNSHVARIVSTGIKLIFFFTMDTSFSDQFMVFLLIEVFCYRCQKHIQHCHDQQEHEICKRQLRQSKQGGSSGKGKRRKGGNRCV